MAKLSARGRKEVWRLTKETKETQDGETIRERSEYAYMSDGHLLFKQSIWFKPNSDYTYASAKSYYPGNWVDKGKKSEEEVRERLLSKGYKDAD